MARAMSITTELGDALLFQSMHSDESLSRLPEAHVELLSRRPDIDPNELLGTRASVAVVLEDGSTRYFNGYITRFAFGGAQDRYYRYSAVMRPWLWFLTRTTDCRIFQKQTVPEIVKTVLGEHPTTDVADELSGEYRQWNYCVQYRESDFNFVSRLMEQEGIYYYYRHSEGHDTLVLTDSIRRHTPTKGYEEVAFLDAGALSAADEEYIDTWASTREIQPGAYEHTDYDFTEPTRRLTASKIGAKGHAQNDGEVFDYPGEYQVRNDGQQYAGVRMDELASQFEIAEGTTNARGIVAGALFTLTGFPRKDQNREYLILSASHDLQFPAYDADGVAARYRCRFSAMPSQQQFRPRRDTPKPFVQGPQTAVVVGPADEEIHTDPDGYGCVRVQFHWDRRGQRNEKSSCWIRVSQPWAGQTWGGVFLPRIGQEVIVDFLEGDPDQPIITGRVYNADMMPPYALPENKTQSGFKSRSSPEGTAANFNEIRFEDKKGVEQLFIHAERNQDIEVEHDETHWVGHDRTKTVDHDETTHIRHDRTETVDHDETITVGGNRSITVHRNETATVALQRTHTVGVNETITVGGAQEVTIGGLQAVTIGALQAVTVGANQTVNVGKNGSRSVGQNDSTQVGKNFVIDAGDSVTIKTGSASITMKKDGSIVISGKDITINGSGAINVKASKDVVIKGSRVGVN